MSSTKHRRRSRPQLLLCVAGLSAFSAAAWAEEATATPRHRIAYATCLGGEGWDQAREIIVFPDGAVLIGAQTCSVKMPVTESALQPKYAGDDPALGHGGVYGGDCYLARLSPDGKSVLAATYFGGSKQERNVYGMALDRDGNVVVTTATRSPDAPTTPGAFQPKYAGGPSDMLVAKISPDLKRLIWCTYVGGKEDDFPRGGLALDAQGNVLVVGTSSSPDFPTTQSAVQPMLKGPRDSALVKLKADGSALLFGTYLGGSGEDDAIMGVRLNGSAEIYVAGHTKSLDFPVSQGAAQPRLAGESDAYLAKLSADASRVLYATYLGGKLDEFAEHTIWLDRSESVLLAGFTASPDFPTTQWAYQRSLKGKADGFLTRLSRDGERLHFSTLLGGSGSENWLMPTVDADGKIYVVGSTSSPDFPVTPDALQPRHGGGEDCALAILSPDASQVLYATYLGGKGDDMVRSVAFGPGGAVCLVGSTSSEDFPATPGALQAAPGGKGDAFVVKLEALPQFPALERVSLFDGKSLSGWRPFEDRDYPAMYGKVRVADGSIILEAGGPMTGIAWQGNLPRDNYEVELEGMRVEGYDFFCGLTFPVGDSPLTLILGGWGGSTVGLSNIDGYSAVENQTTTSMSFESKRWYRIRLRVTPEKVEAWVDDEKKIDLERGQHQFTVWPQQEPGRPLGITSYATKAALRGMRMRALGETK